MDPRLMRYSCIKMGETLDEIKDVAGKVDWPAKENAEEMLETMRSPGRRGR